MKKAILLFIIVCTINSYSQKKYNVEIRRENIFYNYSLDSFDTFIHNLSKEKFDSIVDFSIIDTLKIKKEDFINLHQTILKNIPKNDTLNNIWVIYGQDKNIYFSKYLLGKLSANKKNIFLQINFNINKKTNLIDSINIINPLIDCKKVKPLLKKMVTNKYDYYFNIQQVIFNNTQDLKETEKTINKIENNKKTVWILND